MVLIRGLLQAAVAAAARLGCPRGFVSQPLQIAPLASLLRGPTRFPATQRGACNEGARIGRDVTRLAL